MACQAALSQWLATDSFKFQVSRAYSGAPSGRARPGAHSGPQCGITPEAAGLPPPRRPDFSATVKPGKGLSCARYYFKAPQHSTRYTDSVVALSTHRTVTAR
eukprot:328513-Hanusia_phi.AAC.1